MSRLICCATDTHTYLSMCVCVCNTSRFSLQCNLYFIVIKIIYAVYPKKYAHGFCFAVLCCGYTLTDFPISIRLTSLALWQSNDCSSASKATLMNMDKYFMWIHYERLHSHNKAKHNKTVCIFLGIYCTYNQWWFIFVVHNHVTHIDICLNTNLNVFVIITAINCN